MNLKLLKFILFLPLFIACQAGSEILPPDSGENGGTSDFSCTVSAESLTFDHAYDYEPSALSVEVGEETVVVDMSGAPWMEVEGDVTTITPNSTLTLNLVPTEPNYSKEARGGVILLKGKYTGESVSVAVSQAGSYQDAEDLQSGYVFSLEHSINSNLVKSGEGVCSPFSGFRPSDAILLRTPVRNLAAGTDVSAMINIGHKTAGAKSQWMAEYWDEGRWNEIRKFNTCNDGGDSNHSTFICDFTLKDAIIDDYVKIRFRLVAGDESTEYFIPATPWAGAAVEINSAYPAIPELDYRKVLVLGDSFTYFRGGPFVLKQIARSQGHRLDLRVHTELGATLDWHGTVYSLSNDAVNEGGYHYAILQENGIQYAKFAEGINNDVLAQANSLATAVRLESLNSQIILENTWSYAKESFGGYGSHESFDEKLQKGCEQIARSLRAEISPVGQAFARVRETQPDINCIDADEMNPSVEGVYLKSCVNYLKIFGGEFNETPYNGGASAENAAVLRQIAYKAVNDIPEEKPRELVTFEFDFSSWPFSPNLAADAKGSVKIKTKDAYTFTHDGVNYPIEIYAPSDGYYYTGSALRFQDSGGGYIKLPAVEGKALVEMAVGITNASGKAIYLSSDGSDKGDLLANKTIPASGSSAFTLTGTLPGTSYYLYSKAKHCQIGKIILTYE